MADQELREVRRPGRFGRLGGDDGGPLAGAARISARLLLIAAAALAGAYLLVRLRVVVLPVFAALLLTSVLSVPAGWFKARGWRPLAATWLAFGGFFAVMAGVVLLIVPPAIDEFAQLGPTISQAVDDIEQWFVDGPLGLEPEQVDRYRERLREQATTFIRSSSGVLLSGAVLFVEILAGMVLSIVLTFFFIKDGQLMQRWMLTHLPEQHHDVIRRATARAWEALGAYLRGAAIIGFLEGVVLGVTLFAVGAKLAIPVAVLTFVAGFFPVVGAVVAGILAVVVALVSGGLIDAAIVGGVALIVQQLDNDLLAPFIYGRIVRLHPVVVLLSLTAGGSLGGIAGAFLAVPLAAVATAVGSVVWQHHHNQPAAATS